MKKSLLALAVAAALPGVALAQSSVTLSGVFKSGIASTELSNGAANNGRINAMQDGSSKFVLSGVEDLGGGLKAIFQIDQRFRGEESPASSQASGATWVGLAGGFGSVKLGKNDIYYIHGTDGHAARATPLQMWNVSLLSYVQNGAANSVIANASRTNNLIQYDSPAFGPVSFGAYYSTAGANTGEGSTGQSGITAAAPNTPSTGSGQKGGIFGGQVLLNLGAVTGGVALYDNKVEGYGNLAAGATTGSKAARIWGGFNAGMFSVGLTADQSKLTGSEIKRTAFSLPVTATFGPGTVLFTYTVAQNTKTSGTTNADTGAKMWVLGYDYALSKRTSLGVAYASLDNKAAASYQMFTNNALGNVSVPSVGQDQKQFYVGLRHAF